MSNPHNQERVPVLEGIRAFHREGRAQFTTPGHKHGQGAPDELLAGLGSAVFAADLAMTGCVDDRRSSRGYLSDAEQLQAEAYGADQAFFSTNGSSLSAHAMQLAVADPGQELLITRNMHKSVVAALIFSGICPVYVPPSIDEDLELAHGLEPEILPTALREHPRARGVIVTSPTYYGVTSDLRALAEICHAHEVPLLVDEAWGAHLAFHPDLPEHAVTCGADLSVASIHKTLSGLGEASVMLLKGQRVQPERLTMSIDLLESTSISSLIVASIDGARHQMVREGKALLDRTLALSDWARCELGGIDGLQVMGPEVVGRPGLAGLDRTKLVVDVRGLGMTSFEAADWLCAECGINLELADHRRVMGVLSIGDTDSSVHRLVSGFRSLAQSTRRNLFGSIVRIPSQRDLLTQSVMSPREAFFAPAEHVPIEQAAGRAAAEMISPYPPGIPAFAPGDGITSPIVEFLRTLTQAGMYAPDATDPSYRTVRVLTETR